MLNKEVLTDFEEKIKKRLGFSTWRNHYYLLLKVIHRDWLKKEMKKILKEVKVFYLKNPKNIFNSFKKDYENKDSYLYLFIENGDFYNDK